MENLEGGKIIKMTNIKITHEQYLNGLKQREIQIVPLEKYKGNKVKIKHKCICGNVWEVIPNNVLAGKKCGCGLIGRNSKTHEEYINDLKKKNIKVTPLEEYKRCQIKIKHKCICGNEWKATPNNILKGQKCGCIFSKGENIIAAYFKSNNIKYVQQKRFKDLQSKANNPLKYDFAIYSKNKLIALIEYQGVQHFKYIEYWNKTRKQFMNRKKRDTKKKEYAKKKNIPLIEIYYFEDMLVRLESELKRLRERHVGLVDDDGQEVGYPRNCEDCEREDEKDTKTIYKQQKVRYNKQYKKETKNKNKTKRGIKNENMDTTGDLRFIRKI